MTRERTIRGQVAVVGVGETTYYKHGRAPESEFTLALQAILRGLRGRGHRPAAGGRVRVLQQRPQRSLAPGRRPRPARAALLEHAVGRRRGRRLGGGGQRGGRGGRGLRRLRGRLPRARPGSVPALRRGAARRHGLRRGRPHLPVRADLAGPALRDAGDALHARPRGAPGRAAGDRAGVISSRAGEPARGHARAAADARRPTTPRAGSSSRSASSTAAWRTTAPPRWCWSRPSARADLRHPPAYLLGVGAGLRASQRRPRPQRADLRHARASPPWRRTSARWRALGPKDVDVVQSYENFTGGVLMSLVEHGFFAPEEANDFLTLENLIAPERPAAAQHQRRQSRRVLHARARAADRGGAPAPRRVDQPGAGRARRAGDLGPDGDAGLEHVLGTGATL